MEYKFYGWESPDVKPVADEWQWIENQRHLYDLLCCCWTADTCGPRFRPNWSDENPTLGQCTITSFLVQDIFGGEVYGIALPGGITHCYNVVGDSLFDLTSEQFGNTVLEYRKENPQRREVQFADATKKARYELLKQKLKKKIGIQ